MHSQRAGEAQGRTAFLIRLPGRRDPGSQGVRSRTSAASNLSEYVAVSRLLPYPQDMPDLRTIVHSDPEIHSGTPVFVGTRVPVRSLLDYLEGGDTLEEFLDNFPSVTREQAVSFLEEAGRAALAQIA